MKRLSDVERDTVTDVQVKAETVRTPAALPTGTGLVVTPHPMSTCGQQVLAAESGFFVPGESLAVLLARHGVLPGQQWVVAIGGATVPEAMWPRVRPKHGHLIEARRVPEKTVLRIAALVALSYFTFGAGGLLGAGGFLGLGTGIGAQLAATAVYMAGTAVINKLLGPKPITRATNAPVSPTYALSGGRNRARPFEPIALVLGEPYCVPDLAAQPYTFYANAEAYLWQMFHAGINCASVGSIRIGETAIENYSEVTLQLDGFAAGNTGLPLLKTSVDTVAGSLLAATTAPGEYTTRTSSVDTVVLAVDLEASLYYVFKSGQYTTQRVDVDIEYRLVGSPTWLPFRGAVTVGLVNGTSKPYRVTFQKAVTAGQYEVRMRKVSVDLSDGSASNQVQWVSLKSFQRDTGSYSGQARLAMQIRASGQLNGSLDEVNWVATALPMPYWNGSAWVTAISRATGLCNPGAQILMLARGIYDGSGRLMAGLGFADAQIDIEGLKLFMVYCAAKGFEFDLFLQETTTVGELLESIAAAGLGVMGWPDGKLGVLFFADTDPVEGVLNMGTMKAKSFSVEYNTDATAEEIEFQYFDRNRSNKWKSLRVLAPGVTTPTATARQQLVGVTSEAHAAILARFSMAQNTYQRKTINCDVDLEHLTFRRGTVLALSHDLTQWGYGGRVQACVNNAGILTLTLDDLVPAVSPVNGATSRYIGLRVPGEATYRIFPVVAFTGDTRVVTLASAWPGGVLVPGDSETNPAFDTVWIYDFKTTPGQKLRVADVSPVGNLDGARVALVPETPEFWTYVWTGAYIPPPNTSLLVSATPSVQSLVMTEELRAQAKSFFVDVTATYDVAGTFESAELWGTAKGGALRLLGIGRQARQEITFRAELGETWTLELRTFGGGRVGLPFTRTYKVVGKAAKPPNVTNFVLIQQPNGIKQWFWDLPNPPVDLFSFEVRYSLGTTVRPFGQMIRLFHKDADARTHENTQPASTDTYTFAIVAVDVDGNQSAAPTYITEILDGGVFGTVLKLVLPHELGWPGAKTNCFVQDGALTNNGTLTWNDLNYALADMDPGLTWANTPSSPIVYEHAAIDMLTSAARLVRVGTVASELASVDLATSADNITWTAYAPIPGTAVTARYYKVRWTIAGGDPVMYRAQIAFY